MNGVELMKRLGTAFGEKGTAGGLVMVRETGGGTMFSIKGVVSETHDDADGSTTHWIEVEEY